jgi:hypothetical protein
MALDHAARQSDVRHEKFFLDDEMVGRKDRHHRVAVAFVEVSKREQKPRGGFFVLGLDDDRVGFAGGELPAHVGVSQMILTDDRKDAPWIEQSLRPRKGVLEQRTPSYEIDVLLGKRISAQPMNQRPKPLAFACG